ncbi:MAG TPA: non-canonical purine NTP pyrophosphatase, partial [Isosphaeraceae bacterium]|nr:non-canonical purine NTP pyrophosphatase [Isosphaeraceae bacterium]
MSPNDLELKGSFGLPFALAVCPEVLSAMPPTRPMIVLATRNRKKGEEMLQLIRPPWEPAGALEDLDVRTLDDFPQAPEVVEDADTFLGNARKKASETALALNAWVVADDSGLTVDAINGAPGVYSARYAGRHGDDQANNRKLFEALSPIPDENRGAAFVCALALSDPSGTIQGEVEASCRGRIIHELRGEGGFGYDPLFLIREY